jgi:hypothetical protein
MRFLAIALSFSLVACQSTASNLEPSKHNFGSVIKDAQTILDRGQGSIMIQGAFLECYSTASTVARMEYCYKLDLAEYWMDAMFRTIIRNRPEGKVFVRIPEDSSIRARSAINARLGLSAVDADRYIELWTNDARRWESE